MIVTRSTVHAVLFILISFGSFAESFIGVNKKYTYTQHATASKNLFASSSREPSIEPNHSNVNIGLIGCGTIASAIITAITSSTEVKIAVSRRTASKSSILQETFPDKVTVHDDNQEIVNQSDLIFLCVLPQQTSEVLQSINFDPQRHHLISLVSTATIATLAQDSKLPHHRVSRMICLPAIARPGEGLCLYCGESLSLLSHLFNKRIVVASSESQLKVMMVSATLMGPLYGIMNQHVQWLTKNGIEESNARQLVIAQYRSMVHDTQDKTLEELIYEQTPGGLNEQALANLQQLGVLNAFDASMDAILGRIQGQGDGAV